jgi:hypothetical protein
MTETGPFHLRPISDATRALFAFFDELRTDRAAQLHVEGVVSTTRRQPNQRTA